MNLTPDTAAAPFEWILQNAVNMKLRERPGGVTNMAIIINIDMILARRKMASPNSPR